MKILVLIIYSNEEKYKEMLNLQKKYIHLNSNIESYFIEFKEDMSQPIEMVDDHIYVQGKEHLLNITEKTIKALKYLFFELNKQYDYVIRTNISTIINHHLLMQNLKKMSRTDVYVGGHLLKLQWFDPPFGIFDTKYWGTIYVQGTGIILSRDVVLNMLSNEDKIDYSIADDVAIAVYIAKYNSRALQYLLTHRLPFLFYNNNTNINSIVNNVFIRNKSMIDHRNNDIINMHNQVNFLYF